MRTHVFIIVLSFILIPTLLCAQTDGARPSVFSDYLNQRAGVGFLHIPGLEFHSSMGFTYFSSKEFGSTGMGYYMGHFGLRLSSSLTLRWDIGIRSSLSGPDDQQPELFIPNIDLTYRPNNKFLLRFQYQRYTYPPYYLLRRY
jgi:hypothetical protein